MCTEFGYQQGVKRVKKSEALSAYKAFYRDSKLSRHPRSPFAGTEWHVGKAQTAECDQRGSYYLCHKAPKDDCACGFYSFKSAAKARQFIKGWCSSSNNRVHLVQIWGKVVEYEHGYRSERCMIPDKES